MEYQDPNEPLEVHLNLSRYRPKLDRRNSHSHGAIALLAAGTPTQRASQMRSREELSRAAQLAQAVQPLLVVHESAKPSQARRCGEEERQSGERATRRAPGREKRLCVM